MQIVIISLDNLGFFLPQMFLARELSKRGHKVKIFSDPRLQHLLPAAEKDLFWKSTLDDPIPCFATNSWHLDTQIRDQVNALKEFTSEFKPDMIISHELALCAGIISELIACKLVVMGLATWTEPISGYDYDDDASELWHHNQAITLFNSIRLQHGLPKTELPNYSYSSDLYLLRSIPEIEYEDRILCDRVQCVGSCIGVIHTKSDRLLQWIGQAKSRIVHVTLGRTFNEFDFFPILVDVAERMDLCFAVTNLRYDRELPALSKRFFVSNFLPFESFGDNLIATVSNAHTTPVLAAASRGIPSVLIPHGSKSEIIAKRYSRTNAFINLDGSCSSDTLVNSISYAIGSDAIRESAKKVKEAFGLYEGFKIACNLIEQKFA